MRFLSNCIITIAFNGNIWLEKAGNNYSVYLNISMFPLSFSSCASKDDFLSIFFLHIPLTSDMTTIYFTSYQKRQIVEFLKKYLCIM